MPQTEADINALFAEIEALHEENKNLRLNISKLESRLTKLEKGGRPAISLVGQIPRHKAAPGAVTFMKNPED